MKRLKENENQARTYRVPMQIKEWIMSPGGYENPLCPRCGNYIERDFQGYCDGCGQHLSWKGIRVE